MKSIKKIKRIIKKNPFILPVVSLGMIIVVLMAFLFVPQIIQNITYKGDTDGDSTVIDNPWYLWDYSSYINNWVQEEFEDVIYVHQDGDNTTGGYDWEHAYTDLPSAIAYAHGTPFWTTLILVGAGIWDVLNPEAQYINRQIILVGASRDSTIIRNTHPLANSVFRVENMFSGHRFSVQIEDTCNGIVIEENMVGGMYSPDVDLNYVNFITNTTNNGNPTALEVGESYGGEFTNIYFPLLCHGTPTAINVSNSYHNVFDNIKIGDVNVGLLIENNNSDSNNFHNIKFHNCTTGIQIDAGNDNHFDEVSFIDCATDIDDEVGDSYWTNIYGYFINAIVTPNDLTGIVVNTGGPANTYGVDTLIYDPIAIDHPYYIIAIIYEPSASEKFGIRLSTDAGATYLFETIIEAKFANQAERLEVFDEVNRVINAHKRVWVSIKSESGGDNVDIWLEIIQFD